MTEQQPAETAENVNNLNEVDFTPQNPLEEQLALGGSPDSNPVDLILAFLNNEVFILSPEYSEEEAEATAPLILTNADQQPVLAVFSHPDRAHEQFLEAAPKILGTSGAAIVQNLTGEVGLVINPGHPMGFEIGPEGLESIRKDFKPAE
ncbi:SseB family protein [Pseudarthrobacter sp. J1738]|uniref:SseB family protein n=1 Tax=Pseudarthrobacter sp. J1738 TaxID=3420446 RepID=UPI003D2B4E22